jgi:hypothetical protein
VEDLAAWRDLHTTARQQPEGPQPEDRGVPGEYRSTFRIQQNTASSWIKFFRDNFERHARCDHVAEPPEYLVSIAHFYLVTLSFFSASFAYRRAVGGRF